MQIKSSRRYLSIPYIIFMVVFVLLPLLLIGFYAFSDRNMVPSFDPALSFFTSSSRFQVLFVSFVFGLLNTVISLLIAYPLAFFLADRKVNKNVILVMLFIMPMWINFVLRTWALRDVLIFFNMGGGDYPELATLIGLVYNYLPFTIMPLYTTMLRLDKSQIEASQDLGANPFRTFRKIIIPMTMPGVVSAATMVFMPTMTSYVISDILGEGKVTLFGKYIEIYFGNNQWHDGAFLALVMLLLIGASVLVSRNFNKRSKRGENNVW